MMAGRLLGSEGNERIDARCPSRRHERRQQTDRDEQTGDGSIRERIEGADTEEQSFQQSRHDSREHYSDRDADEREASALRQYAANDVRGSRAERHAQADLLSP